MNPIQRLTAISDAATETVVDFTERQLDCCPEDDAKAITATMVGLVRGHMLAAASLYGTIKSTQPVIAREVLTLIKSISDKIEAETDRIQKQHKAASN